MAKSSAPQIKIPDFYDDPLYHELQTDLVKTGRGMLVGDLPDFYSVIGKSNSPEFQDVLSRTNRDIEQSTLNAAAKTGTRGGATAQAISRAVGDNTSKMRWQDLLSSVEDKKWLLGTGINTISGARDSQFGFMGAKNSFNLSQAQLLFNQAQLDAQAKAKKANTWAKILSAGIGAAGTLLGGPLGGVAAGAMTSGLGSASGGSSGMSDSALDFAVGGINSLRGW